MNERAAIATVPIVCRPRTRNSHTGLDNWKSPDPNAISVYGNHRACFDISPAMASHFLQQLAQFLSAQSLDTNPDDGWCAGLRKRKKRVEISIQSDNDPALGFSPCQDLLIIG